MVGLASLELRHGGQHVFEIVWTPRRVRSLTVAVRDRPTQHVLDPAAYAGRGRWNSVPVRFERLQAVVGRDDVDGQPPQRWEGVGSQRRQKLLRVLEVLPLRAVDREVSLRRLCEGRDGLPCPRLRLVPIAFSLAVLEWIDAIRQQLPCPLGPLACFVQVEVCEPTYRHPSFGLLA